MGSYAHFHGVKLEKFNSLEVSPDDLKARLSEGGVAGVIVQQPDYYGIIEDFTGFADACHGSKALFIINSVAADLALLKTPGEWGADLAVGDVQSLGIPMAFGGPYAGYMCSTEKLMRKLPGRIVGETRDTNGQRAFVLTLQAREQHIRREKATSNICTAQGIMCLYVAIYLSLMGPKGLVEVNDISMKNAHYLCDALVGTGHFKLTYDAPFLNEFCLTYDGDVDALIKKCAEEGILAGVKVDNNKLLVAVTEQRTKAEMDLLVSLAK